MSNDEISAWERIDLKRKKLLETYEVLDHSDGLGDHYRITDLGMSLINGDCPEQSLIGPNEIPGSNS